MSVRIFGCGGSADGERPDALTHVRDASMPYAARHGLKLLVLRKITNGQTETLMDRLEKSILLPVRMGKWLKEHGAADHRACRAAGASEIELFFLTPHGKFLEGSIGNPQPELKFE